MEAEDYGTKIDISIMQPPRWLYLIVTVALFSIVGSHYYYRFIRLFLPSVVSMKLLMFIQKMACDVSYFLTTRGILLQHVVLLLKMNELLRN